MLISLRKGRSSQGEVWKLWEAVHLLAIRVECHEVFVLEKINGHSLLALRGTLRALCSPLSFAARW
jgi:hypothetical protein